MSKVLIAGGTGLIGKRLSKILKNKGYEVALLSRQKKQGSALPAFQWNLQEGWIEEGAFDHVDYVINLSGAGIADRPWTQSRKKILIDSRVQTTALLSKTIQSLEKKPKAFISAAAIGIYGDRGDEILTESSSLGKDGFMVECCKAWENAVEQLAKETSIRTAAIRIGIVLSSKGGALEKMLLPLKFFTASYFGDGRQWYSWIHIDDLCNMFMVLLENDAAEGIFNGVAPEPMTNKELTKKMVKALGKKAFIVSAPKPALRMGMGEMADVVLNSNRVLPKRMQELRFPFQFADLSDAVKDVVSKGI